MTQYDLIVIGCGGIGSATLFSAATAGLKTLCLEQYVPGHIHGGTHGETRAFRKAYYEHPSYIPLLQSAYSSWKKLSANAEQPLFVENGIVEIADSHHKVLSSATTSAQQYQLPCERLTAGQISQRFPGFRVTESMAGVFQPEAGFLYVDKSMRFFVKEALRHGATINSQEKVMDIVVEPDKSVKVITQKSTYYTESLIITVGAWTTELLSSLSLPIQVVQKKLVWFPVEKSTYEFERASPCFAYHLNEGLFYGFPSIDGQIKVARHSGGLLLSHPSASTDDASNEEAVAIEQFAQSYLLNVNGSQVLQKSCLYDSTSDNQFIIDLHPQHSQIAFAAGLSGHAYKMSNVLGDVLVDLVTKGSTQFDISFLSLDRFR